MRWFLGVLMLVLLANCGPTANPYSIPKSELAAIEEVALRDATYGMISFSNSAAIISPHTFCRETDSGTYSFEAGKRLICRVPDRGLQLNRIGFDESSNIVFQLRGDLFLRFVRLYAPLGVGYSEPDPGRYLIVARVDPLRAPQYAGSRRIYSAQSFGKDLKSIRVEPGKIHYLGHIRGGAERLDWRDPSDWIPELLSRAPTIETSRLMLEPPEIRQADCGDSVRKSGCKVRTR